MSTLVHGAPLMRRFLAAGLTILFLANLAFGQRERYTAPQPRRGRPWSGSTSSGLVNLHPDGRQPGWPDTIR